MWQGRPTWAEIDLDAVAHNTSELKKRVGGRTELLAVVKANGYGHGAVAIARTALEAGASRLGVACVDEGAQLRKAGISCPILILGYTPVWEAEKIVHHQLSPTVGTKQLALALARFSAEKKAVTQVHVKVETGMGRFGTPPAEVVEFAQFLGGLPNLKVDGLYTHFAVADEEDKGFTHKQFGCFLEASDQLSWIPCCHVGNSATVLDLPDMYLDMVRPGISLYGIYPSAAVNRSLTLKPALTLKSRIGRLHPLAPGDSVSYGRTWIAEKPARVALITCGYADGLPRILSNRGSVLVRGVRAPIRGRICMDQCVIDVSHIPDVALDDEVVIIGRQGNEEITAEEVAALAGTISYEILCGITARVPRVYIKNGSIWRVETLNEFTE